MIGKFNRNFTTAWDKYGLRSVEGAWEKLKRQKNIWLPNVKHVRMKEKKKARLLEKLIKIVKFFGSQNLVFQESSECHNPFCLML